MSVPNFLKSLDFRAIAFSFLIIPILFLLSSVSSAEPNIQGASGIDFAAKSPQTITILGSGFGTRSDFSSPVMLDLSSKAYVFGKLDTHQLNFSSGQSILRAGEGDAGTLWDKPSKGDGVTAFDAVLAKGGRGDGHRQYFLEGPNSYLGWPTAYGGSETPTDNNRLYVAWYLKMKYDPRYYWAISPENLKGNFSAGESVTVNGIGGSYVGVGKNGIGKGMLHFEFEGQVNANNMAGNTVTGEKSGASVTFPKTYAAGTGTGYQTPGSNKYLRVWEEPDGKKGVRISWTQMQVHKSWNVAPVTPGKWHLMEFFLDTSLSQLKVFVDRDLLAEVDVSDTPPFNGLWSPTIALLGWNGKLQEFQETYIDDIYIDSNFSRVVIGDKPKFSQLENYELQVPISWSNSKINFILNPGELRLGDKMYAYVIAPNGGVNETGFSLCASCKAPPSAVPLQVE